MPEETAETHAEETPARRKLTREEWSQFELHCLVCSKPIPFEKATKWRTCSPECARIAASFKRYLHSYTRCPSCMRPSSPAERELFKKWRKSRGETSRDVMPDREWVGRVPKSKFAEAAREIRDAVDLLEALRDTVAEHQPRHLGLLNTTTETLLSFVTREKIPTSTEEP